ncbi:Ppx/GppA family phosphatase [Alkalilacustris brevis]|uniref:Ppx/GppA family phosphatase n=1 Tax=Alkalilacustris brevis TaxID=2026338 RepID=UPI000E0D0571|nr:Ppx/GppA family phosphatase [Alkalilacustris brevis]
MDGAVTVSEDDDPFGKVLFNDPSARALSRVGVIDVGSNSVRMVVFDGAARSPAFFFNEKVLCGLGRGLYESGRLHPEGRVRALAALKRFALLSRSMALKSVHTVATAAVREAADGPEFCAEVEAATGLRLHVIDGQEEARLSGQGVLLGWPGAEGLVCDIGGSSMELAGISAGAVERRATSPLGPFWLQGVPGGRKGLKVHVRAELEKLVAQVGSDYERLYLVGGSWRALARLDMLRRDYPLTVLHEYEMTPRAIRRTIDWLEDQDVNLLKARTGLSRGRIALVPLAAVVLRQVLWRLRPKHIHISAYGLREGVLYEQMPPSLRARDPLIEACSHAEQANARMPGFGRHLFGFLRPLYTNVPSARLRLVKAACLLHDVSWRAHPDYRAEACFDNATRANLGGLDHRGRVFLGVALMHRYRNSGASEGRMARLAGLLSETDRKQAEVLGKAMRFGAMFSADGPETAGRLRYYPKKRELELVLTPGSQGLYGEVVEARFKSLAKALGCDMRMRIGRTRAPRPANA